MPHSILLGRPWPKPGHPLWLDEDLDKLRALFHDQSLRCPRCNTYEDDWRDEDGMPLDEPVWGAEAVRCLGCRSIEVKRDSVPPKEKGVAIRLERIEWVDDEDDEATPQRERIEAGF